MFTVEATAEGGNVGYTTSYMEINEALPGPRIDPDKIVTTDANIGMAVSTVGDRDVVVTGEQGDGTEFVSSIVLCKDDEESTTISGMRLTTTHVTTGSQTLHPIIGRRGICTEKLVMAGGDCIRMINLVVDSEGNAV